MKTFNFLLLLVASIVRLSLATTLHKTKTICTTKFGASSPASVPTASYTSTSSVIFTEKTTITSTSTRTPRPTTITQTATQTLTSTFTGGPTSLYTTTQYTTLTSTITDVSTLIESGTIFVTTTPPGITIPTRAGFTPLASASDYVAKHKRSNALPMIRGRTNDALAGDRLVAVKGNGEFSPPRYPTAVTCGVFVKVIATTTKTYTATTKVKTTAPTLTSTATTTATITLTINFPTVVAPVTITSTITTSTTTVVTSTITSAVTVTVAAPTPTSYAACGADNLVGSANGDQGIFSIAAPEGASGLNRVSGTDALDCCVLCQTTADCRGFGYYPLPPDGTCYIFVARGGQCDGSRNFGDFYRTSPQSAAGAELTIGNGNCGQLANGGIYAP